VIDFKNIIQNIKWKKWLLVASLIPIVLIILFFAFRNIILHKLVAYKVESIRINKKVIVNYSEIDFDGISGIKLKQLSVKPIAQAELINSQEIYFHIKLLPLLIGNIRIDDLETPVDVGVLYAYGNPIGFLTTVSFIMNMASLIIFLGLNTATDIVNGLTVFDDADVKGDLHVRGEIYTEWKTLSINYDITYYGNFQSGSTTTNQTSINAGNIAIRDDLKKLFPVTTISTLSQVAFNLGAEVRVLCKYNTATSVRRFILDDVLGVPNWEPYNLYYNTYTGALNNIVT
jgi:hypothetical protein